MDSQEIELRTSEITLRSVDERIKQATDPILRRLEDFYALLADRIEMESAGNKEASSSRRDNAPTSPSRNRHDLVTGAYQNPQRFSHTEHRKNNPTRQSHNLRPRPTWG